LTLRCRVHRLQCVVFYLSVHGYTDITTYELLPLPLVNLKYGLISLTSANFSFAFSVLTGTGTIKSSPTCQSIGLANPSLSVVCKLSITRSTSALLRPVLAGYVMLSLIFLLGSMMKTERIVRTMSLEPVADSGSMSYSHATPLSLSAMMGKRTWVEEMSLMSSIQSSWEPTLSTDYKEESKTVSMISY